MFWARRAAGGGRGGEKGGLCGWSMVREQEGSRG